MSDYIKREDAIKAYAETIKSDKDTKAIAEFILAEVPSADVVEVVRCKDCKHKEHCFSMVHMFEENERDSVNRDIDYCSYGERKNDECE